MNAVAKDVLTPEQRDRVRIIGFRYRDVYEKNWWKNSTGLKSLIGEHLLLWQYRLVGDRPQFEHWDPDEYQQWLETLPDARPRSTTHQEANLKAAPISEKAVSRQPLVPTEVSP